MPRVWIVVLVGVVLLICSCVPILPPMNKATYVVGLAHVERPVDASTRYGDFTISTQDSSGTQRYSFEDGMISSWWVVGEKMFHFSLVNKTNHSLKIIWDEAVFVDPLGSSGRVSHSGVKYTDVEKPQSPTVVPRGAYVKDIVLPTSRVQYGSYSGWIVSPLLPSVSYGDADVFKEQVEQLAGQSMRVLLPIEIQGVVNEYTFAFEIVEASVEIGENTATGASDGDGEPQAQRGGRPR